MYKKYALLLSLFCCFVAVRSDFKEQAAQIKFVVGNYKIADRFWSHLAKDSQQALVLKDMQDAFNKLNKNQQELYIEFINQSTERVDASHEQLMDIINRASSMIRVLPQGPKYQQGMLANMKGFLSNTFEQGLSESYLRTIIPNALLGDQKALIEIQTKTDFKKLLVLSLGEKQKIVKKIQVIADELLQEVNDDILNKTNVVHESDSDEKMLESSIKELGVLHSARTLAIIKYCNDVVFALSPMCKISEKIMLTVDRHNWNPILNVISFDLFSIDLKETDAEQITALKQQAEDLQKKGLLQIPQHKQTVPLFYNQLRALMLRHKVDAYAKQISIEIQQNKGSNRDKIFTTNNNFKFLSPETRELFFEKLSELLAV